MQNNLHVTVAAIVEDKQRFLLVQEKIQGELVYNQPAGHLEENETLVEAVIRECQEETAWLIEPQYITGIYQWTHPANQQTFLRVCFYGIQQEHSPQQALDEGIVEAVWLSQEALLSRQISLRSPLVTHCINDYLSGNKYPLELIRHIG